MVSVGATYKKRVTKELGDRGWTQRDLARKIPCSPAAITLLLKPETRQSRLVPYISKLFGWEDTTADVEVIDESDARKRLDKKWPKLSEKDQLTVATLVESLASKP